MIDRLKFYIWRLKESYYRKRHILRVVATSTGVKIYNPVPFRNPKVRCEDAETIQINPKDLFMGPDYLKDEYSLLGVRITESPHRYFIQGLLDGDDMRFSVYMNRLVGGYLDARPITLRPRDMSVFKKKCQESFDLINSGDYEPVQVYELGNKYYIKDGKHRASMCAIIGIPVKCIIIKQDFTSGLSFHIWKMMSTKMDYKRHISFFKTNNLFV